MDPIGLKAGVLTCPNCRAGCTKGGYLKCTNFMIWFSTPRLQSPKIILLVVPEGPKQPVFSRMFVYFQPFPKCWCFRNPVFKLTQLRLVVNIPLFTTNFKTSNWCFFLAFLKPRTIGSPKLAKNCWKNVLKHSRPGFLGWLSGDHGYKLPPVSKMALCRQGQWWLIIFYISSIGPQNHEKWRF